MAYRIGRDGFNGRKQTHESNSGDRRSLVVKKYPSPFFTKDTGLP